MGAPVPPSELWGNGGWPILKAINGLVIQDNRCYRLSTTAWLMQDTLDQLWSLPCTAMSTPARSAAARVLKEPSPEELSEINSIIDIMTWAKVEGHAAWSPSMLATFMKLVGLSSSTDIDDYASIEPHELEALLPSRRHGRR